MSLLATFSNQSSGSLTVSDTFTVPAGATFAQVSCGMRGGDGGATTLTSVVMGGVNFVLDSLNMRRFDGFQGAEMGYMLAANLPSGSVTATATRGTATDGFTIEIKFFDDAEQVAPLVILNGDPSSPIADPFVTNITPTAAAILSDIICTSTGTAVFTVSAGQTESSEEAVSGNSLTSNGSTKAVSSGAQTMGWATGGNANRTTHIVMAINGAAVAATAALTGTVTAAINEADIVAGGETIILTLTGDTFVAAGATFDAARQAIIDGLDGV